MGLPPDEGPRQAIAGDVDRARAAVADETRRVVPRPAGDVIAALGRAVAERRRVEPRLDADQRRRAATESRRKRVRPPLQRPAGVRGLGGAASTSGLLVAERPATRSASRLSAAPPARARPSRRLAGDRPRRALDHRSDLERAAPGSTRVHAARRDLHGGGERGDAAGAGSRTSPASIAAMSSAASAMLQPRAAWTRRVRPASVASRARALARPTSAVPAPGPGAGAQQPVRPAPRRGPLPRPVRSGPRTSDEYARMGTCPRLTRPDSPC